MNLILINGYAPTEDKQQDEKEAFYEDLNTIFESIAKSQPKIILGDFNAKIGKEEMYRPTIGKESLHTHSNENGNRLINFAISKGLRISSTYKYHNYYYFYLIEITLGILRSTRVLIYGHRD